MVDINMYQENNFHTKMMLKTFELEKYLFETQDQLSSSQKVTIQQQLKNEMIEIFNGRNYDINSSA